MADIVTAKESFSTDCLGYPRNVRRGETFTADHVLVKAHPGAFEEFKPDHGVEQATASPGEKRSAAPTASAKKSDG